MPVLLLPYIHPDISIFIVIMLEFIYINTIPILSCRWLEEPYCFKCLQSNKILYNVEGKNKVTKPQLATLSGSDQTLAV